MKNKFTKEELVFFGFSENHVTKEESGSSADFIYFSFDPYKKDKDNDTGSLISEEFNALGDGNWDKEHVTVEFFNLKKSNQPLSFDFVKYYCDYFAENI
jgi:hypothetical protein